MAVLDIILLEDLIDSTTTVNTDFSSKVVDISYREDEFSVQLDYDNGSTVDMDLILEVSNDNITFLPVESHNVVDATGTSFWDVAGSGAVFMRVSITVNSGSIDLQSISYRAKRRH